MGDIWTARISSKDKDTFNITRKSGNLSFAPTWDLVRTMQSIRLAGREASELEFQAYRRAYLKEMNVSYKRDPMPWVALLAKKRVVLTCYCVRVDRCHRTILAQILGKMGGNLCGELYEGPSDLDKELLEIVLGDDE